MSVRPRNMPHMVEGVLIAESLRVGCQLTNLDLAVTSLTRSKITTPAPGQPPIWTFLTFRSTADPDQLAAQLSDALSAPGWYIDFHDEQRTWVVYPQGKVFSYDRGDAATRTAAQEHARTLRIPDAQLDWHD
jgi:hypothetical protein